MYDMKYTRNTR